MSAASKDPFRRGRPKRFAGFENICLYLIAGQFLVFAVALARGPEGARAVIGLLAYNPELFFSGDIWRAFTFVFLPPFLPGPGSIFGILFLAIAWYLLYLMGSFLEESWGALRLNLFLLLWWGLSLMAATVAAFVFGQSFSLVDTYPLKLSVFLAFAFLNPNFTLMLFFVLPVKVIWLAVFFLVLMAFRFTAAAFDGQIGELLAIGATLGNIVIFFGPRAWFLYKQHQRRERFKAANRAGGAAPATVSVGGAKSSKPIEAAAFHKCAACGRTDQSHPDKDFRYVQDKQSGESRCYCLEYIQSGEKCSD
ncbi:MAG: hypothetical protein ACFB20_07065 [Opitutales bacterium]